MRLGEPLLRAASRMAGEARQGLVAHDFTRRQVDDRLEHDVELSVQHHGADPGALAGSLVAGTVRVLHLVQQLMDQAAADNIVEDRVPARGVAERRRELLGGRIAHHVAARAGAEHPDHGIVVRDARVREYARVRGRAQDLVESDLRSAGEAHVHECHVRLRQRGQLGRLGGARGHAHQLEFAERIKRGGRSSRHQILVVRDENADWHPCHGHNLTPGETEVNTQPFQRARNRNIRPGFATVSRRFSPEY